MMSFSMKLSFTLVATLFTLKPLVLSDDHKGMMPISLAQVDLRDLNSIVNWIRELKNVFGVIFIICGVLVAYIGVKEGFGNYASVCKGWGVVGEFFIFGGVLLATNKFGDDSSEFWRLFIAFKWAFCWGIVAGIIYLNICLICKPNEENE